MPLAPTVTIGGTSLAIKNKPVSHGGTAVAFYDNNDLVASVQLQGQVPYQNPFQEVNLFLGEFSRVFGLQPRASILRVQDVLEAMLVQFYQ